jgi:hypothetical protein
MIGALIVGMFLVFLTLRLCGVIAWSWWMVTWPLWGTVLTVLAVLLLGLISDGLLRLWLGRDRYLIYVARRKVLRLLREHGLDP